MESLQINTALTCFAAAVTRAFTGTCAVGIP